MARVIGGEAEARRTRLEPLAGGTRRRSWLVTFDDGRRAVLRTPVERSNALLDLATEARAMDAAAGAGLAPLVIAADAESGVLLTDYRPGTPWTPGGAASSIESRAARGAAAHAARVADGATRVCRRAHRHALSLGAAVRRCRSPARQSGATSS